MSLYGEIKKMNKKCQTSSAVKEGSIGDPRSEVTEFDWLIPPKVEFPLGSEIQH